MCQVEINKIYFVVDSFANGDLGFFKPTNYNIARAEWTGKDYEIISKISGPHIYFEMEFIRLATQAEIEYYNLNEVL